MSLLGIPISYALLYSTKYGVQGFGTLWPIRLMGFAVGIISFTFITYFVLGEGVTLKTGISLILATVILLLQLIWSWSVDQLINNYIDHEKNIRIIL